MNSMFGNTLAMTGKSLDYLWTKQTVSLNNIANIDTPGYKAQYVTFEEQLKRNLQTTKKDTNANISELRKGIIDSDIRVKETSDAARFDGNNVHAEVENTELVRSYIQYQAQVHSMSRDIRRLKTAITGQ